MIKKSLLIFSGYNDRAIVAFCRYCTSMNIPFFIIANGKDDLIYLTEYKKNVLIQREENRLILSEFLFFCNEAKKVSGRPEIFILPSTEYLNRFLLTNRVLLDAENVSFGLCDGSLYEKISDKYSFTDLCKDFAINVPIEYSEIPDFYPFVIKPKSYGSDQLKEVHERPKVIENKKDLDSFMRNHSFEDYYIQEYVNGKSYYLLYFFGEENSYKCYSQENIVQQEGGKSMIYSVSSNFHLTSLSKKFVDLFIASKFNGLIMVEVKEWEAQHYMIEANPRLWGPSQLILDSGMSLFNAFCKENGLIDSYPILEYSAGVEYFWSGGLVSDQSSGKQPKYYNIDPSTLINRYSGLMENEVYLRQDSLKLFHYENTKQ